MLILEVTIGRIWGSKLYGGELKSLLWKVISYELIQIICDQSVEMNLKSVFGKTSHEQPITHQF